VCVVCVCVCMFEGLCVCVCVCVCVREVCALMSPFGSLLFGNCRQKHPLVKIRFVFNFFSIFFLIFLQHKLAL